MHVGYIVSRYPSRSHTFIRREIELLRELGVQISVFSLRRCDVEELISESDRTDYQQTWSVFPIQWLLLLKSHISGLFKSPVLYTRALAFSFSLSGGGFASKIYSFMYFVEAIYLSSKLRESRVTTIHAHFVNAGGKVAAVAAKFLDLPWILSIHGNSDFGYPSSQWLMKMVHDSRITRCVSAYGASQIRRHLPIGEHQKVIVSYCGLPEQFLSLPRRISTDQSENLKILVVGRLSPEKGQMFVLEVVRRLLEREIPVTLDLIGDGPDRPLIEEFVLRNSIGRSVTLIGAVEEYEVLQYMTRADILICPSYMEGLPQVLMEAMLLELPVVAPYLAGIPELIDNRINGRLFPAGDYESLEAILCELYRDKELLTDMAKKGRKTIEERFVLNNAIESLHLSLNSLN